MNLQTVTQQEHHESVGYGMTERVRVHNVAQSINEDRWIQRQCLTFDNWDTIPVCHYNSMKAFNTEGGEQTVVVFFFFFFLLYNDSTHHTL